MAEAEAEPAPPPPVEETGAAAEEDNANDGGGGKKAAIKGAFSGLMMKGKSASSAAAEKGKSAGSAAGGKGMEVGGKGAGKLKESRVGKAAGGFFAKHMDTEHKAEYMGEFIGTFIVCCGVGFAANLAGPYASWAAGAVYCVMFYTVGDMGGGHFNPAVTIAWIAAAPKKRMKDWPMYMLYMTSQMAGAFSAFLVKLATLPQASNEYRMGIQEGKSAKGVIGVEFVFTTFLITAFLSFNATRMRYAQSEGLTYGYAVVASWIGASPVSGCCLNPVVFFAVNGFDKIADFPFFAIAHGAAAVVGAGIYRWINQDMYGGKIGLGQQAMAEFMGVFFLTCAFGFGNLYDTAGAAPLALGSALMVGVYAFSTVSGALLNPAVTFAVFFTGRRAITAKQMFTYMFVQLLAGACGGVYYVMMVDDSIAPGFGANAANNYVSLIMAEMYFTGYLIFVVLAGFVDNPANWRVDFLGLGLGAVIWVGGLAVGTISTAHFNPAVSLGMCLGWSLRPEGEKLNQYGQTNKDWAAVLGFFWFAHYLGVLFGACLLFMTRPQEIYWPCFMRQEDIDAALIREPRKPEGQVDPRKAALGHEDAVEDHPEPDHLDSARMAVEEEEETEQQKYEGSPANSDPIKI